MLVRRKETLADQVFFVINQRHLQQVSFELK